jgi:hypothetical protein
MRIFCVSVCILCFYSLSHTVEAGVTQDVDGWTVVTPSVDTRIVYVSNSVGNDVNDGLSEGSPVQTIARGKTLLRNGYPDWLLLKKGDTWLNEAIGSIGISGRSADEPMLFSSYGAGARPLMRTDSSVSSGIETVGDGDYLAVVGLEFYAYTRDPDSPDYLPNNTVQSGFRMLKPTNWLLLEDNKFSFYGGNSIQAWPSGIAQNVSLRRNVIMNNYSNSGSHSQGVFTYKTNNLLIEGNFFYHNGWNHDAIPYATSTIYNRNMYLSNGNGTTIVRDNIDIDGASGGVQLRTGGTLDNNLFVQNPIAIVVGSNENPAGDVGGVVHNNVILGTRSIDTQAQGTGITISSNPEAAPYGPSFISDLEVYGNIVAHGTQGTGNITGITLSGGASAPFTNTQVHDNVVYNWSKPTWSDPLDHRAYGFSLNVASSTNTNFFNNTIQQPNSGFVGGYAITEGQAHMYDNRYFSIEANNPPTQWSIGWYGIGSSTSTSAWLSHTGETGMQETQVAFTDPDRTIETYMTLLGMTSTLDAFVLAASMQSKDTWDDRFTTDAVNNYVRVGFDMPSTDLVPPFLGESTPIGSTTDTTPAYTFTTTESGTIAYSGSCTSATTNATLGSNTITLSTLAIGTYSDCTITVEDSSGNVSTPLTISSFTITTASSGGGGGGGGGSSSKKKVTTTATTTPTTSSDPEIQRLLTLLAQLRAQLALLLGKKQGTTPVSTITRDLELGMEGEDVRTLQKYLNTHGYIIAQTGPGSPNNETTRFGPATMQLSSATRMPTALNLVYRTVLGTWVKKTRGVMGM